MDSIQFRQAFGSLFSLVREGKWCRNRLYNGDGQYCMLGMVREVARRNPGFNSNEVFDLLNSTIPEEEMNALKAQYVPGARMKVAGEVGMIRGFNDRSGRIATFNNTRESEAEITAWIERAEELAYK